MLRRRARPGGATHHRSNLGAARKTGFVYARQGREGGGREGGGEGGKEGAAHLVFTAGRQPGALDGRCQKYERHLHLFFLGFQPSIGYISSEHSVQPLLSGKVATWWGFEVFVGGGKDAALTYQQIGRLVP